MALPSLDLASFDPSFDVTENTIGYFFMYIGAISVFTRVLWLGRAVDRMGEARLSRVGIVLLASGASVQGGGLTG